MRFMFFLVGLEDFMLPCMTKKIFGFDCPGCGLQRSVAFLLKGDFAAALEMYPAIFPLSALILFSLLNLSVKIKYELTIKILLAVTTGIVIITSYILKMNHLIH